MGGGDSRKLLEKAFVHWLGGEHWFLPQESRYGNLGAKPVSAEGYQRPVGRACP